MPETDGDAARMIAEWRSNLDRVRWWQEVLKSDFGREIAMIVREYSPETELGDPAGDAKSTTLLGQLLKASEGSTIGMIAGHNRLRNLLFKKLNTLSPSAHRLPKPGEQLNPIEPHHGTPPP